MPVTSQPQGGQWMAAKNTGQKCRPGLELLAGMNSIHLKQKIDMLEVITGWQVKNKFRITDPETGNIVGLFKEESTCCQRQCFKNGRTFSAKIIGENDTVLFQVERPCHCQSACCPKACNGFCGQEMTVNDSSGRLISNLTQLQDCGLCPCCIDFGLLIPDDSGNLKYILKNNMCKATCCEKPSDGCCTDKYLWIFDADENKVGSVVKKWRGCATECCTPADSLLINFPDNSTAEDKAAIVSATLLADYNLWEKQDQ